MGCTVKNQSEPNNSHRKYHFRSWEGLTLGTLVVTAIALIGGYAIARLTQTEYPQPTLPPLIVDDTQFSEWEISDAVVNDIVRKGITVSLTEKSYERQHQQRAIGAVVQDPQGYLQSPKRISENVFICTKVLSKNDEIDYSLRLNNKFQVIHGDGDNRTIALKVITSKYPNGEYWVPDSGVDDRHVDSLNRYRLDGSLDSDTEFISCLTITADAGDIRKTVQVELHILDGEGKELDLGPMPSWTLVDDSQINGKNHFSVGLIDSRDEHPVIELRGYCAVEMNDLGDRPSERERERCVHL